METVHDYSDELLSDRELLRRRLASAALRLTEANQEYLALIEQSIALNADRHNVTLDK